MRTKNATVYTIDKILTIALGYKSNFSVIRYSEETISILLFDISITFNLCNSTKFHDLLNGKIKLEEIDSFDKFYKIKVLKDTNENFYTIEENGFNVNFDILSIPFILLSNLDEYLSDKRDKFDRFEYKNSFSKKCDLISIPTVDEYAFLLRSVFVNNFPQIEIKPKKSQIIPTHDIDDLYRFTGVIKSIKSLLSQLYQTKNFKETSIAFWFFLQTLFDKKRDPYFRGITRLLEDSQRFNLKSIFFFMTADLSKYDSGCQINDVNLKNIFLNIINYKMSLGLHPGFYTFRNQNLLQEQILKLKQATNSEIKLSRQHYLRLDRQQTFQYLESSGIKTDFTMGFAEQEGFRCGTAHEYQLYNIEEDKPYNLLEKPLIAMDVTLSLYKKYSAIEASNVLDKLYKTIQRTEGDFVILWHNAYVYREVEFYKKVYLSLLSNEYRK